jgi:secondary thiamine-phosphate synthase enzyme
VRSVENAAVQELKVETERKTQLLDITEGIAKLVDGLDGLDGSLVTLFVPHTTAGIVLQAAGPGATAVAGDIETALERIVDESWSWKHVHEGDANPWSHVRAALTTSSVSIPLEGGRLMLGADQAVFLAEFDGPRERTIRVTVSR